MKPGVIVAAALLVLGVAALVFGAWLFFKRPLELWNWMNRQALRHAGVKPIAVDTPAGRQTVFVGGDGPVVVLLHGAGDQAGTWAKAAPDLVKDHRLIVPDLPGHGTSEPRTGPLAIATILAGVEAVLSNETTLGKLPPKITIVGNSLGGWIAMLLAQRHPERIARVVVVDGGAVKGSTTDVTLLPRTREEARNAFEHATDPSSPRAPWFVLDDMVRIAQRGTLARLGQAVASMEPFVLDGRLAEIKVPVDLVWGESDRIMPLDYARKMQAELPNARLTTIPRCGHVPQQECPGAFLAALRAALQEPSR